MLSKYTGYSPVVRVLPKKAIFLLTDFCRVAPEPQPFVSLCSLRAFLRYKFLQGRSQLQPFVPYVT